MGREERLLTLPIDNLTPRERETLRQLLDPTARQNIRDPERVFNDLADKMNLPAGKPALVILAALATGQIQAAPLEKNEKPVNLDGRPYLLQTLKLMPKFKSDGEVAAAIREIPGGGNVRAGTIANNGRNLRQAFGLPGGSTPYDIVYAGVRHGLIHPSDYFQPK